MNQSEPQKSQSKEHETPDWLKLVQINSWEAELLISALLLYMLFQVPEVIDDYRQQHYPDGFLKITFGIFITALKVLRIGYSIHIIARGIWVASVGLSSIYPISLNPERLKFKNRFKKEIEQDIKLEKTIKRLEKVASLSYAISFMLSGMVISAGLLILYLLVWQEFVINPSVLDGNKPVAILGIFVTFLYLALLLILFIDFITNGFFRREPWASKPFCYIAVTFRIVTLSFIFNRINLSIISNLPRWQAYLVPVLSVAILAGYMFLESQLGDWDEERYLETAFVSVNRSNYENLRGDGDPMFATIQNDVIDNNIVRLFINTHGQVSQLYSRDDTYERRWNELSNPEQSAYARKYIKITVDEVHYDSLDWLDYIHPNTYNIGFLNYIDIKAFEVGLHTLTVELDTVNFNSAQNKFLKDKDPVIIRYAKIDFYKSN